MHNLYLLVIFYQVPSKVFIVKTVVKIDIDTLIFCESVSNIARISIPKHQAPVGGNPYSGAVINVSSKAIASSSPDC